MTASTSRAQPGRIAVTLLMGTALAGCEVGPDYKGAPALALAPYHNAAAVETRTAGAPPKLDAWWTGFHDPELSRIVDRALAQNLDLAASMGRVRQARAAAQEAGARLLPTGVASADALGQHQSLDSPDGVIGSHARGYDRNQTLYDIGAGASWEVDLAGGLQRGAEAAEAEAQAAEDAQLGLRVSIAAEAADAYLQIRGDQARLTIARDQVATDDRLLTLIRQRRAEGAATDREVAQAEALLFQARGTLPPILSDLEAQSNRLDVLMGAQPGTYAAELAPGSDIPAAPAIDAGAGPADLFRRRPDVMAAERTLAASHARIGVATAEYYPKLSLSALLGFESLNFSHLPTSAAFQPQGVMGLRWRLFDFGKVDAEVAEAEGADATALAQYRQSMLIAAEDVENAFSALVQSEAQTRELQSEVTALTRARDASEDAYRNGAIALTDVLDADRQLLTARDQFAQEREASARAAVASFRALGGGWSN